MACWGCIVMDFKLTSWRSKFNCTSLQCPLHWSRTGHKFLHCQFTMSLLKLQVSARWIRNCSWDSRCSYKWHQRSCMLLSLRYRTLRNLQIDFRCRPSILNLRRGSSKELTLQLIGSTLTQSRSLYHCHIHKADQSRKVKNQSLVTDNQWWLAWKKAQYQCKLLLR